MSTTEYRVTGMSCGHCEQSVRDELAAVAGVERVEVSAATGTLIVHGTTSVDDAAVLAAVGEAGYRAERAG
jgi:copper chaperone CopZ